MTPALWLLVSALSLMVIGLILLAIVVVQNARTLRRVGAIEQTLIKLRIQMSNMIRMLLNAGFKVKRPIDWSDDEGDTRRLDAFDTQWDWRKP